jgi:anti-sigma regulatory factor (Ser/Thr protein kinase)
MILEKQKEANVLIEGQTQESIGMSLDLDSAQILMQMLSKNLYSDDIGSAIRECTSNALDSHRRAGIDTPIVVSFKTSDSNNYEFCVEDFGIGLDADDVRNIISKYGKSTKRNSANELGMMGLGFKAPLAYSSSFYFVCRKDGMERKYMMYEGEDTNTIDLLYEKETEQDNGVKIIIPVKYSDKYQFMNKIKEQLCYFESVYFDVPEDSSINNDFIISRHEHFQFSEMSTDRNLHICLDNVYYPVDFEKLGISRIEFPIGLRFSLSDGLFPTPNRESLRYTQEAKKIILDKFAEVADNFVTKYNDSIIEGGDIKSVVNHLEQNGYFIPMANGHLKNIEPFIKFATIDAVIPKIDGIKLIDFPKLYKMHKGPMIDNAFPTKFSLRYKRMSNTDKHYVYGYNLAAICNGKANVYLYQDKIPGIKKDYLRATCDENEYNFFVKPGRPMKLGKRASFNLTTYYHLLDLRTFPKSKWRDVIKEYQHIISLIEENFINLDEFEIPEDFIDARKKKKTVTTGITSTKRLKLQGEIVCKKAVPLLRYSDGKNCKFDSQLYKLEDLHKAKHLKVYAKHGDSLKLDTLYGVMEKQKMEVITFSDRELKIIDQLEIHNLISYDKFMEGTTAPFKRIVTAALIHKLVGSYGSLFNKIDFIGLVSTDLKSKLTKLVDYRRKNYQHQNEELTDAMIAVAEEHNLYDENVYTEYLEMKVILEKLPFLDPICSRIGYWNPEDPMVNVVADLFKYYKYKVNLNLYKQKEVLTEESLEVLA